MADTKLYKVAITPCGKYVHGAEYDRLCLVLNATEDGGDGCSYVSLQKNRNVRPGTDNSIWALSLERGERGQQGPSGAGFSEVEVSVSDTSGTPSGSATIANDTLYLSFSGMKGAPGEIDQEQINAIETLISAKQDALVSGTNIKTIGNQSILGSGNIQVGDENAVKFVSQSLTSEQKTQARTNIGAQDSLVSGTNIKTINQTSLLGSGNIDVMGIDDVETPSTPDGTAEIVLTNGDVITLNLNHSHPEYYSKIANSAQPSGGFLPDVVYSLGTLTGTVTFALAAAVTGNVNHYYWIFSAGSTAPTITFPASVTKWTGNCVTSNAPVISANKRYEVSVLDGVGFIFES